MYKSRSDILKALTSNQDDTHIFSGTDYERGELETQAAAIENAHRFCLRLARALVAKGLFTKREMVDLIFEYSGCAWEKGDPTAKDLE
jgi:hypothetical protein